MTRSLNWQLHVNLDQLKTFVWVHKCGGFRRAAEKLNTTQPAVSNRIQALETSLGVQLMERGPGGVKLTAKGHELISLAENVLGMTEVIKDRIGNFSEMQGTIHVGVSETIAQSWLSLFLVELSAQFPKINVELTVDVSVTLREALLSQALDLAFLMGPISEYTVTNIELPSFPLSWYVARQHEDTCRDMSSDELFSLLPVVTYARNTRPFREIKTQLLERYGFEPRMFPSTSLAACLSMVRNGVGVGTLPVDIVESAPDQTDLVRLELDWEPEPLLFTASFVSDPPSTVASRVAKMARDVADDYYRDN